MLKPVGLVRFARRLFWGFRRGGFAGCSPLDYLQRTKSKSPAFFGVLVVESIREACGNAGGGRERKEREGGGGWLVVVVVELREILRRETGEGELEWKESIVLWWGFWGGLAKERLSFMG